MYSEVGAIDRLYGPKTKGVVKAFQHENHLEVDGTVNPETWTALFSPEAISR